MTTEEMKLTKEGKEYWQEYLNVNGWAMYPNTKGLKSLNEKIGVKVSHLKKCINMWLEA